MVRVLEAHGFILIRQRGSHARYKHPDGRMTSVPMHGTELKRATFHSILKQAGIPRDLI